MKKVFLVAAFLVISFPSALAAEQKREGSLFVLGGYQYIQAAALQLGNTTGMKGIGVWAVDLAGDIPITPQVSVVPGFSATQVKSTANGQVGPLIRGGFFAPTTRGSNDNFELKTTNFSVPLLVRIYTSEPGHARGYIDLGPSVNFLKVDPGGAGSETKTKIGGTMKAGARFPLSEKIAFETVAGYDYIAKHETLDMSNFRILVGFGILWNNVKNAAPIDFGQFR